MCKYLGHWRPKSLTTVEDVAQGQVYSASSPKSSYEILNLSNNKKGAVVVSFHLLEHSRHYIHCF